MVKKIVQLRREKPEFNRVDYYKKKVSPGWRRPKGKYARRKKVLKYSKGAAPNIGYSMSKEFRGLHPSGYEIVEVENVKQLEKIDANKQGIKIKKVGKKKKIEIIKAALEKKIKILNVRKPEEFLGEKK